MAMIIHTERLKMARYKKGLSLSALSEQVGLTRARLIDIEAGKANGIRPENALKICNVLEIDMEDLISFV